MGNNNKCSFCGGSLGSAYYIRWKNYVCLNCQEKERCFREDLLNSIPEEVEELPPIEDRYQLGIIALTEARARAIVEKHYAYTPSMDDLEC